MTVQGRLLIPIHYLLLVARRGNQGRPYPACGDSNETVIFVSRMSIAPRHTVPAFV